VLDPGARQHSWPASARDLVVRSVAGAAAGHRHLAVRRRPAGASSCRTSTSGADRLAEQRARLTRLVLGLPAGARTGVLTGTDPPRCRRSAPTRPALSALSRWPAGAAALPPAERLQAALADFAPGPGCAARSWR
jgi:hypothetical protein